MKKKNKKILIKYKNYIFLYICIFIVFTAASVFENYKNSFKKRLNTVIIFDSLGGKEIGGRNIEVSDRHLEYVKIIANNNTVFFLETIQTRKSYEDFLILIHKKINNSYLNNVIDTENIFFRTNARSPSLYLDNKNIAVIKIKWGDAKLSQQRNTELRKILFAAKDENIDSRIKTIENKYKFISEKINNICKTELPNELLLQPDQNSNKRKRLKELLKQCEVAISRIEKDNFFENVMKENIKQLKSFPSLKFATIFERGKVKSIFQLLYENILISVLMLVSILILRNFIIKISK